MAYLPTIGSIAAITEMLKVTETVPQTGCFIEVGIYTGGSASYLTEFAEKRNQPIYLYDTFSGLPYSSNGDTHAVGEFNYGDYDHIKNTLPYAEVVKGIFPESAVEMPDVAFVHLDVDQYESYVGCINYLKPKMLSGGVMWFDDYELPGAKKAIDELIGEEKLEWIRFPNGVYKVYTRF
jgi:hypothetical protein